LALPIVVPGGKLWEKMGLGPIQSCFGVPTN
jgi:hypothetical protein